MEEGKKSTFVDRFRQDERIKNLLADKASLQAKNTTIEKELSKIKGSKIYRAFRYLGFFKE